MVVFPLVLAVAPVKINVPLLPNPSRSFSLNARMDWRAKAKAATTFVSRDVWISSGVILRKGFQTPYPALKTVARRVEVWAGQCERMAANADSMEALSYAGIGKGCA